MKITLFILSLLAVLTLTGCFEQPEVVVHEPGKYMGKEDPLLKVAGSSEQDELLAKRFQMVQTDR